MVIASDITREIARIRATKELSWAKFYIETGEPVKPLYQRPIA